MSYIEAMLPPAWTWENQGKVWQIDHIRPLSEGVLSCPFELYRLAHCTNLQPLSTRENIAKGPRRRGGRPTSGLSLLPPQRKRRR